LHSCSRTLAVYSDLVCGHIFQKCGKVEEQIELLKQKLKMIYLGEAFNGKATKKARSHGKKFQVSIQQETSRILVWFASFVTLLPSVDGSFQSH
jgi:hypothetical protein